MKRTLILQLSSLSAVLLLVGCGGGTSPAPEATPTPAVSTSGSAIDIVPQGFQKGDLPPSLDAIEDDADQVVLAAAAGDWSTVDTKMAKIDDDWSTFQARPEVNQLPQDQMDAIGNAVEGLREAVKHRDAHPVMRAANNLAAFFYVLAETYHPDLPPQLGLLRVTERNVMLDAQDNDMVAADETLTQLQTTWQEVRDRVTAVGGADVAASFDQAVARQQAAVKAGDAKALETEARQTLPLLERMEGLGW